MRRVMGHHNARTMATWIVQVGALVHWAIIPKDNSICGQACSQMDRNLHKWVRIFTNGSESLQMSNSFTNGSESSQMGQNLHNSKCEQA